jgi:hypothetical protein
MPIVVHMHTSIDNQRKYGAEQASVFLNELLAAAPDVPVQIAHLAGSGGYPPRLTRRSACSLTPLRSTMPA